MYNDVQVQVSISMIFFEKMLHLTPAGDRSFSPPREATGDRLREAQHINRSLSALADVVVAKAETEGQLCDHLPTSEGICTE